MNTKTNLAAIFIASILCLLAVMFLSSCAPKPEGQVLGHGWDGSNYYLMIAQEGVCDGQKCVEGLPFKVTEEEYNAYKTGDFINTPESRSASGLLVITIVLLPIAVAVIYYTKQYMRGE